MSFASPANTTFLGLATTTAIFAGIGGTCLVGFEVMRQLKRLPSVHFTTLRKTQGTTGTIRPSTTSDSQARQLTCEDWEMGHLYHARTFHATTPTPPMARWPLLWAWQAVKFDDWFYATHTGMDTVVYVRFLKWAVLWVLLHTLTTAPTLLAIHFHYSQTSVDDRSIDKSNMARASLSYVASLPSPQCASPDREVRKTGCVYSPNPDGQKILWVHLMLLYYMAFTWWYALWRIAHGSLRIRWRFIQQLRQTESDREAQLEHHAQRQHRQQIEEHLDTRGWRQRTLMVSNLPASMREEAGIRRYFEEYLRPDDASTVADDRDSFLHESIGRRGANDLKGDNGHSSSDSQGATNDSKGHLLRASRSQGDTSEQVASPVKTMVDGDSRSGSLSKATAPEPKGPEPDLQPDRHLGSPVQAIVLVRKMDELSSLLARRQTVLGQLEAAHVKLATAVLSDVRARLTRQNNAAGGQTDDPPSNLRDRLNSIKKRTKRHIRAQSSSDAESNDGFQLSERNLRIEALLKHLGPFVQAHDRQRATMRAVDAVEESGDKMDETVWEALAEVPRELLDAYQPVTRLSALFRGQTVPTIDYLLTKLNLLTALVTEMRARPPSSYAPASTAFVTFRDPRQARMVWRELKDQIVVKVRLAPEVKDLDWERLMNTTFSGEVVRGAGVSVVVWGLTIFWTILINFLTVGLANFTDIGPLKQFFLNNPKLSGFVSTTLPSLAVALITMGVPELVFQISKRAQGFVTFSQLYDMCLTRYWKFAVLNVVVFFSIGSTVLLTIISTYTNGKSRVSSENLLSTIAYSFPSTAPYFVSYLILGMGLHSGFELLGFMVPLFQHWGARKTRTPRERAIKTLPRIFNRYYWLPFHVLIMTILFIFTLINPLVTPFGLVYLCFALIVFKKNLAFTYYRRFNEKEGVVYFVRILRFSLDGLIVGQVVLLILFSVSKLRAVYIGFSALIIPLTVIFKLLGTRWWRSQCRALDEEEACALCGLETLRSAAEAGHIVDRSYGVDQSYNASIDAQVPLDARASGRYPPIILPPETNSVFYNTWQKIHDSFHANGYDRPSFIAQMGAKGEKLENPAIASARAISHAPATAARMSAHAVKSKAGKAKVTLGFGRGAEQKAMEAVEQVAQKALRASASAGGGAAGASAELPVPEAISEEDRVHQHHLARNKSARSRVASSRGGEDPPFLSSFDVLNSHAPVPTRDDDAFSDADDTLHVHSTPRKSKSQRGHGPRTPSRRNDLAPIDTSVGGGRTGSIVEHGSVQEADFAHQGDPLRDPDVSEFGAIVSGDETPKPRAAAQGAPANAASAPLVSDSNDEEEDGEGDGDEDESDWDEDEDVPLVRRHAPVTWDDTPNNSAKYHNPFYGHNLDPFLWLPRDPTQTLNLFDTIEWYGAALVSSQGGAGNVGEWEEDEDEEGEMNEKGSMSDVGGPISDGIISGKEEILLNDTLARHLEEAEEVEVAQDPSASLPKAILNDYRNAIRQNSRSETGDTGAGDSINGSGFRLDRQDSHASGMSSIRSPTRTIRMQAEQTQSPTTYSVGPSRTFSGATTEPAELSADGSLLPSGSITEGRSLMPADAPSVQITDATFTTEPDRTVQSVDPHSLSPVSPVRPRTISQSAQSAAMAPASTGHGIVFAGTTKAQDHQPHPRMGMHPRRSGAASNVSHATAASLVSSAGGHRPVTLQQALRAEILEEEWRTTLKERLITLRRSKMVSKLGPRHRRQSAQAIEDEAAAGATAAKSAAANRPGYGTVAERSSHARPEEVLPEAGTTGIMARHALRRQLARSEAGEQTVEEMLHGGGHQRAFSLSRGRSRSSRRQASASAGVMTGLAAVTATALPSSATWNPTNRAAEAPSSSAAARRPVDSSMSISVIENVPMREFGARSELPKPKPNHSADT